MSTEQRRKLYSEIEKIRAKPLVTYVTSARPQAVGVISSDAVAEIQDQLILLPEKCDSVDLLIVSLGGDPTAAYRIVTAIRERVKHLSVIIPYVAFSAATLIALGADEIIMLASGNLGPVDPQIHVKKKKDLQDGIDFGSEDLAGFLDYAKEQVGLTDQEHLKSCFELFCNEVGTVPIGIAARSARLSVLMGTKLLQMHMTKENEKQKAQTIATTLNKEFFHHGYPVASKEAKEIGLKISKPQKKHEEKIISLWNNIEEHLKFREPFNPIALVHESASGQHIFGPILQANIPANLPQQIAQPLLQQILNQAVVKIDPIDYNITYAIVESARRATAFSIKGKIFAKRDGDMKVSANMVSISSKWEKVY